jgi:peptide-methionine (S)-S-oxide reductase
MSAPETELATLAGGCFWCLEAVFENLQGVSKVESGYMGGATANPTYRDVCSGTTGHAEVVQVTFDPALVTFADLLDVFFTIHDPTTLNRQGNDVGTQYRSAIFYHTPEQKRGAEAKIAELTAAQLFDQPVVTEVTAAGRFFKAEDYHQGYFRAHREQGYCQFVVAPKVAKFRKHFTARLKS